MITAIDYQFNAGELCGPDTTGIDELASVDRYADLLVAALQTAYPGATAHVSWRNALESKAGVLDDGEYVTYPDGSGDRDNAAYDVYELAGSVYQDSDFYVYRATD